MVDRLTFRNNFRTSSMSCKGICTRPSTCTSPGLSPLSLLPCPTSSLTIAGSLAQKLLLPHRHQNRNCRQCRLPIATSLPNFLHLLICRVRRPWRRSTSRRRCVSGGWNGWWRGGRWGRRLRGGSRLYRWRRGRQFRT